MGTIIRPFTRRHVKEAGALVTSRYATLRRSLPRLPALYEDVDSILDRLSEISRDRPGAVALDNGVLVGFLTAHLFPSFRGRRAVYSPEWANAAVPGDSSWIYQDMYAHLSGEWAREHCICHLVTLFADDASAVEGWLWEGFGLISVDALTALLPLREKATEGRFRQATLADVDALWALSDELRVHVGAGPTFLIRETEPRSFWESVLQRSDWCVFLAMDGNTPSGYLSMGPSDPEACLITHDRGTVSVREAYVRPNQRRRGMATELLDRALIWARSQGHERCAVSFEPMNITASRFWLKHFQPICFSMQRILDEAAVQAGG